MSNNKRVFVIVLASLAGLCLVSVAIFAVRNWSNPPISIGTDVAGAPYSIAAPDGWKTTPSTDASRDEEGLRTYEWIASPSANGVSVMVKDVMKEGRSFEEVANALVWTQNDVAKIVAFMRDEADGLYKDFSEKDMLVSSAEDVVGGARAVRSMRQCLKPCYVEGGAATTVRYVVDATDRVFVLEVTTGTGANAADLLNEADAVVRTFKEE